MSNIKISQLNNATTPLAGTEVVPIVQSGSTKKVSVQDIADLASGGSSNPSVIALTATNGTAVTGTTVNTLSQSLLIPANTFTGDGMLEILTRAFKTGTVGSQSLRAYKNTSASLTGATLIATFMLNNTIIFPQGIRTFRINSNTLSGTFASTTGNDDYVNANGKSSTTFDITVDNYIIIAIQLTSAADSSVVEMARAVKYI